MCCYNLSVNKTGIVSKSVNLHFLEEKKMGCLKPQNSIKGLSNSPNTLHSANLNRTQLTRKTTKQLQNFKITFVIGNNTYCLSSHCPKLKGYLTIQLKTTPPSAHFDCSINFLLIHKFKRSKLHFHFVFDFHFGGEE